MSLVTFITNSVVFDWSMYSNFTSILLKKKVRHCYTA